MKSFRDGWILNVLGMIKLIALGALIAAVGGLLKGHDVLTAIVLISSVIIILVKFFFLYGPPSKGGRGPNPGGDYPLGRPVPVPPVRPRPREFLQR